eukprot:GFYU01001337.1.p1 GENE.GFYU01001337.1~~GFYU01001337.1.p1  ORF type:complete len:149 (-),score=20.40 GFYU01001337.1:323-769(-)
MSSFAECMDSPLRRKRSRSDACDFDLRVPKAARMPPNSFVEESFSVEDVSAAIQLPEQSRSRKRSYGGDEERSRKRQAHMDLVSNPYLTKGVEDVVMARIERRVQGEFVPATAPLQSFQSELEGDNPNYVTVNTLLGSLHAERLSRQA